MSKFILLQEKRPDGDFEFFINLDFVSYISLGKAYDTKEDIVRVKTIDGGDYSSSFDLSSPTGKKLLEWLEKNRF